MWCNHFLSALPDTGPSLSYGKYTSAKSNGSTKQNVQMLLILIPVHKGTTQCVSGGQSSPSSAGSGSWWKDWMSKKMWQSLADQWTTSKFHGANRLWWLQHFKVLQTFRHTQALKNRETSELWNIVTALRCLLVVKYYYYNIFELLDILFGAPIGHVSSNLLLGHYTSIERSLTRSTVPYSNLIYW